VKVLHLTLKKKWFDMILSGQKREEYREIKPYWNKRLSKSYDAIKFRNGYSKTSPAMLVALEGIYTGLGIIEHGAPQEKPVYILKLGEIIAEYQK
tara:strand:- start:4709 stop:4993 length:285 start_codon:yes stop_codon:yes gene_type:complete